MKSIDAVYLPETAFDLSTKWFAEVMDTIGQKYEEA
jgi:hypothetical protein